MLFSLLKPTAERCLIFLEKNRDSPFSYLEIGFSKDGSPDGYDVDFNEIRLGEGPAVFEKAKIALQNWRQFPADWCFIGPEKPPIAVEQVVTMSAKVLGTWWTNVARIVYLVENERQFGFAYGTLAAHVERGEELFLVDWRADDSVWYSVRAFSRPKILPTKINYPFARELQKRFVRDSRLAMFAEANELLEVDFFKKNFDKKMDTGRSPAPVNDDLIRSKSTTYVSSWLLTLIGFVVWLAAFVLIKPNFLAGEWPFLILAFAALVCSPMAFDLAENALGGSPVSRFLRKIQLPAAVAILFVPSVHKNPEIGAWLVVPWFCCTVLAAVWGTDFLFFKKRAGGFLENLPATTIGFGLVFMAIGGAWLLAAGFEWQPMGFDPVIVFLTAIHFHFAGLVLPILTGLAAQKLPGRLAHFACLGVLGGVPLTAAGITASQFQAEPWLEILAASWMATAGVLTAILHGQLVFLPEKWHGKTLFAISAMCLAGGMVLAFLYGIRSIWPTPGLDIPWMRALHGTLNSLGFAGFGLTAWMFMRASSSSSSAASHATRPPGGNRLR